MLIETVGILAVTAVGGPTTGLRISDAISGRPKHAEKCFGMHSAGANLYVVWLL